MMRLYLLSVCFCAYFSFSHGARTLQLLQEVFRHGDRSPISTFPTDQYANIWPQGFGQLTKIGMREQYDLGNYVKTKYTNDMEFVMPNYTQVEVHARSTDVDRTLMSAYSHLAGLYPPTTLERFRPDLKWNPIPVHTVENSQDHLLNPDAPCPRAEQLFMESLNSPELKQYLANRQPFYDFIAEETGIEQNNIMGATMVRDVLYCQNAHGIPMPAWLNDTTFEELTKDQIVVFKSRYGTEEQGRLRGGPLLREMRWNMEKKMNGSIEPAQRKLFIFSGHDSTVTAFLGALKLYNNLLPPYAAAVLLELWKDEAKQYSVRILYKNDTEATPLALEGCEEYCPWEKFESLTANVVPDNWHEECDLPLPAAVACPVILVPVVVCVVIIVILLVFIIVLAVVILLKRNKGYNVAASQPMEEKA